jgi:hypothetical protein
MVDARNFSLNTDNPLDQVIWLYSDSKAISGTTSGTITIPHGLPFTPLVSGSWSLDSDFGVLYEYSSGTLPSGNATSSLYGRSVRVSADSTNVYLAWTNTLSATTIYLRLFAFQPSDEDHELEPTAASGDVFAFSSDYNYAKLLDADFENVSAGDTVVIPHNLGYRPQVLAWARDMSGRVSPMDYQDNNNDSWTDVVVTSTSVTFVVPLSASIDRIDYRIYADGSV